MDDLNITNSECEALLWILSHSEEWSMKFDLHPFIYSLSGDYFYRCELHLEGSQVFGFGWDSNKRRAQLKSATESLERYLMLEKSWPDSSGVSLHPVESEARDKAVLEAMERDGFFCHFYTQTPFCALDDSSFESQWNELLAKSGATGILRRIRCGADTFSIVAIISDPVHKIGVCLGLGISKKLEKAICHAQEEALSFYSYLLANEKTPDDMLQKFLNMERPSIIDHGHLGMSEEYTKWFFKTYLEHPSPYKDLLSAPIKAFSYPMPSWLKEAPLYLYRAEQNDLQRPSWGKKTVKNIKRLSEFLEREVSEKDFPVYPHCLA